MSESGGWTFRDGRAGRFGIAFAAVWLVFLVDTYRAAWTEATSGSSAWRGWVGLLATAAFTAAYLLVGAWVRARRRRLQPRPEPAAAALVLAGLVALMLVMSLTLGQEGTAAAVYVAVIGVMCLPTRAALVLTAALAVGVEVPSRVVAGWTDASGLTFAICTAAVAMWGVQQLMLRNVDLLRAREENARLAVAEERNRFARDLHDILGHSLTVITVKAELAGRLLDVDRERARAELADLERLSRDALTDVRRAVEGYRELTLPGELARARAALQAADITADLPHSADEVATDLRELFAWTIREGVTNVIRHSGATTCTVRLSPTVVEVVDDGTGPRDEERGGNGLRGLRERAAAAGALLATRSREPHGFALEVSAR